MTAAKQLDASKPVKMDGRHTEYGEINIIQSISRHQHHQNGLSTAGLANTDKICMASMISAVSLSDIANASLLLGPSRRQQLVVVDVNFEVEIRGKGQASELTRDLLSSCK